MIHWFASRTLTIGGMILAPLVLRAAGDSSSFLPLAALPWLGLLVCLHLLARQRQAAVVESVDRDSPHRALAMPPDRSAEMILSDRVIYERTVAAILEDLVHCGVDDHEESMSRMLSRVGSYLGASHCYLYRLQGSGRDALKLLTWKAPGDTADIALPQTIQRDELAELDQILDRHPVVLVNDVAEIHHPLLSALPWSVDRRTIGSCAWARIVQDGERQGFLGFDAPVASEWAEDEEKLLQLVAGLLSSVFTRLDAQRCQLEAMEALEASNRAKSEFLANMSHEIRTPLNGVIGIADLLTEMNLTPPQQEYVDIVRTSGTLLMSLVNDVLDLSKIEAGRLVLDPVDTDLRALIEDLIGPAAFTAHTRGLEVICRLAPGLPARAVLDPDRVRQVLINLLGNATKFTQQGHIFLNIEPVADRGNLLDLRFEVTDTGIGLAAEEAERIFDKFTQADPSTTRRFGGTGLGLSICRHLVELMGGRISATGVAGKGSTFTFTIPVVPVEAAAPVSPRTSEQRVLLVGGHTVAGEVLAEQIRNQHHRCRLVSDANEARDLLAPGDEGEDALWDLVIVDPTTLVADAGDLLARIADLPAPWRPRVALLAGSAGSRDGDLEDHRVVTAVLPKPVRRERLTALLNPAAEDVDHGARHGAGERPVRRPSRNLRIMLAEDNPVNQKVARGVFELLGCQVSLAKDGREAVTMAAETEFDLIFMDCQMPIMDGYEAARQIRAVADAANHVPIIALTANALCEVREACLNAGMDDFLTKPVNREQLDQMIVKWEPAVCSRD